ncbi:MAG: pyridoxamine 5'-phosphate oxidase family protein [Roseivirga sp.]
MLGVLNNEQIDTLLRSELVGRIGCHGEGMTYIVPVAYAYDGENIYGHTREGLKTKLIGQNPAVCFQVDAIDDMANWRSVILHGKFEKLEGQASKDALQLLANRMMPFRNGESSLPKFGMEKLHRQRKSLSPFITYRIHILEKSGRFEKA